MTLKCRKLLICTNAQCHPMQGNPRKSWLDSKFLAVDSTFQEQWNPALRTPALYGQFRLSRQKAYIFSLKFTHFIRTPVNTDNWHFSVSRVTNSLAWLPGVSGGKGERWKRKRERAELPHPLKKAWYSGYKLSYIVNPALRTLVICTLCLFPLSQLCDNCRHCTLFK